MKNHAQLQFQSWNQAVKHVHSTKSIFQKLEKSDGCQRGHRESLRVCTERSSIRSLGLSNSGGLESYLVASYMKDCTVETNQEDAAPETLSSTMHEQKSHGYPRFCGFESNRRQPTRFR